MSNSKMSIPALIAKKRDGEAFSHEEIQFVVDAITNDTMDHAQIGAWLMAVRLKSMSDSETAQLTRAMTTSGEVLSWPAEWKHLVVDKHSTGGVGDKVSLVLAPALAACGLRLPMISGRGLAHTGGTLDKLESIPGLSVSLSMQQIRDAVERVGCCIVGQTPEIVPADGIMYAIRDVTATVDSLPLIAGSIVSKKVAEGIQALVLDVKFGRGAVMQDRDEARNLAKTLASVSNQAGVKTAALLTRMDSPLGRAVGNALEVAETISCLHGNGPDTLVDLVSQLGGQLMYIAKAEKADTAKAGAELVKAAISDGRALAKFCKMIQAQGVDSELAETLCRSGTDVFTILPKAKTTTPVTALETGYIAEINAMTCANASNSLGAGRSKATDRLDYAVGLRFPKHVGDYVKAGETVMELHHNTPVTTELISSLQKAVHVQEKPLTPEQRKLVWEVITPTGECNPID